MRCLRVASVGCVLSAVASRYRSAGSMLSVLSKLMIFISAACETAVCSALAMSIRDRLIHTQNQNN